MRVPYVIDNQSHRLADILGGLLREHQGRSLDVATAYFTVGGFGLIKDGLLELGNFRLLLGAEPSAGEQLGLRPDSSIVAGLLRRDLEALPFDETTLRTVEDLIAFLRRDAVQVRLHDKGFLHAKCWLFYSDRPGQQMLFDRFRPILAIVGSSNFTAPGLSSNRELNLTHKVLIDPEEVEDPDAARAVAWLSDARPSERITAGNRQLLKSEVGARAIIDLEAWYERNWNDSRDFKDELIELLDASKFGRKEYTPFEIYMKALYEYFKDELEDEAPRATRSAVELSEFQEDAVKKARKILARYDGVIIADSVGLGKTWIGKKLLEDFAYHMRQKAVAICPASLREIWEGELADATISASVISQEELGREEFDPEPWSDADVVLIDESHNFRNPNAQRYASLEQILGGGGRRGRDGARKKVILLTATPINNDLMDLYNQLSLITGGDRSYFAACGIGDVYRYFLAARRSTRAQDGTFALFNLLEEVVIRRTRAFIRSAYPEATIAGRKVHFPSRKLKTVRYNLEATYGGIYEEIVSGIESLALAPYNLESYKKKGVEVDEFEAGREQALVGIFKSRYLKRFESSVEAFRISVRRALAFLKTLESYILDGRVLRSADFHRAMSYLNAEDEDDDATPRSLADEMDASADGESIRELVARLEVSQRTICLWRRRYREAGLAGLRSLPRAGRPRTISAAKERAVLSATMRAPAAATHWSTRRLAKAVGLSHASVHRIWQKYGLQPHRVETFKFSTDPEFDRKLTDVVGLYLDPPERALVLCVDEKSQIQALDRTQSALPMWPGLPARRTHDYARHGTTSLFAALEVATGKVHARCFHRHRHVEFIAFLNSLARRYPGRELHLTCDNYGTVHDRLASLKGGLR